MKLAKRGLIAFACVLVLGVGAAFGVGEYLSRPTRHSVGPPPPELFATPVLIPAGGEIVSGWIARGSGKGAVLLLHAVRADRRQMQQRALFLNRLGYSVLLVDQQGHGESTGKRITFGAREADSARAAIAYLARSLPGEKIGVIGVSLGAASTVLSKPGASISALVVEAMYPTIEEATADRMAMYFGPPGALLVPLMVRQIPLRTGVPLDRLRPIDAMGALACPVFVIGGTKDRHTLESETRRIFAAAHEPKQLWMVEGAAHVDFHEVARAEYEKRVGAFLALHLR
ncbi:MAG: alpha/beta hydrolase [Pseudomonadota bacterium]